MENAQKYRLLIEISHIAEDDNYIAKLEEIYSDILAQIEIAVRKKIAELGMPNASLSIAGTSDGTVHDEPSTGGVPHHLAAMHSRLDEEDIAAVTKQMNELGMFREEVPEEVVGEMFRQMPTRKVIVIRLMALAYMFEALSSRNLIGRYWQTALARQGSILLRNGSRAQTSSAYSSALLRAGRVERDYKQKIDALADRLAEKHSRK